MSNTIKKEQIEQLLNEAEVTAITVFKKVTVVAVQLPSGFVVVESSGAVDEENYDFELGKDICLKRIQDKLWELEGYVLQKELAKPLTS